MKLTGIAYAATAFVAAIAGVAVAGLPSTPEGSELVVTARSSSTSSTTERVAATTPTTEPAATTTRDEPERTTTTVASTTTTTTTAPPPTTPAPPPLLDRSQLRIGVANATDQTGVARQNADFLQQLGYVNVVTGDTESAAEVTTLYAADGVRGEAERLATDLTIPFEAIVPIAAAPPTSTVFDVQLLVVIGLDRTG